MNELRILVAEDMQDDVVLLKHAFQKAGVGAALHFVTDGQEAVDYLNGAERYANRAEHPLPTLLLLDLNMPRLNGFDVLEWLRQQPGLRRMPVVAFTSSELPGDIARAYELGVNSYLVKPAKFGRLEEVAHYLEHYWLNLNRSADCAPGGKGIGAMPTEAASRPILLADENSDDGDLFRHALRKSGFENPLLEVRTGDEAISYLRGEGQYSNRARFPLPHLLLVAPGLPRTSGWEVLQWIRQRPEFSALAVIMFGGNGRLAEKDMAYRFGANACHPKPSTTKELEQLVKRVCEFWLLGGSMG